MPAEFIQGQRTGTATGRTFMRPIAVNREMHGQLAGMVIECLPLAETREVFSRFAIETMATRYSVAGGNWSDVTEIIVTGPSAQP